MHDPGVRLPVSVRPAEASDAEGIARVHSQSWRAAYRGLVPDERLAELSWERRYEWWSAELVSPSDPQWSTMAAVDDAASVVGFISVTRARDEDLSGSGCCEILAMYAAPEAWGQGVGAALLTAATDALPPSVRGLALWVLTGNSRGRRFYEGSGFAPDGTTRMRDLGGVELELMRYRRDFLRGR